MVHAAKLLPAAAFVAFVASVESATARSVDEQELVEYVDVLFFALAKHPIESFFHLLDVIEALAAGKGRRVGVGGGGHDGRAGGPQHGAGVLSGDP